MEHVSGTFIRHEPCPECESRDNVGIYEQPDGTLNGYCFGCETFFKDWEGGHKPAKVHTQGIQVRHLEYQNLTKRGISEETCRIFKYGILDYKGQKVQAAPYKTKAPEEGTSYKCRTRDKDFFWLGSAKHVELFGQHLWSGGGNQLIITEGEIDALSISEALNNNWEVVSVPNGAAGAANTIKENLEWVESFKKIILAFDNDDSGRTGVDKIAQIITPGKLHVINWGKYKDANEVLVAEGTKRVRDYVFYKSDIYRPDGILTGNDISLEELLEDTTHASYDIMYPKLHQTLKGLRKQELTLLLAGSGSGKSTFSRELAFDLLKQGATIGYIALEESVKKSALGFIAIDNNVPLGELYMDRTILTKEEMEKSYQKVIANNSLFLYDHFGSLDGTNLLNKIRYMAVALECDYIFLDHISIVISGTDTNDDERRMIDKIMTNLRSIAENTGSGVVVVSHVKNKHGKSAEEGGLITMSDARGSGSLKQLSDNIISLERDMTDEINNHITTVKVLKNRLMADIGTCDTCEYNLKTGRLLPLNEDIEFTKGVDF